jgi:V/A-type H+-transporting ATPase subunit C
VQAYLNTRVSLFSGNLWPPGAFDKLAGLSSEQVKKVLDEKGLGFVAYGHVEADSLSLEAQITTKLLDEARILLRPLRGSPRQFLLYWLERFEISNIKTIIRAKLAKEKAASIIPRLADLGPFALLDLATLIQVEDVDELLSRLEAGPYSVIVRNAHNAFEESRDPFMLDATLDRTYYEVLAKLAQEQAKEAGKPFQDLMAYLIDRINLTWLLRYRFNYNLPPAQVYFLLPGNGYHISNAMLKELVSHTTLESAIEALPPSIRKPIGDARSIPSIFMKLEQEEARTARRVIASPAHVLARSFAYLILRERDLRRARAVARGYYLDLGRDSLWAALGNL